MAAVNVRNRDQVLAEFAAKQAAFARAQDEARQPALEALEKIVTAIRCNPGTGQVRRLVAFLGENCCAAHGATCASSECAPDSKEAAA